MTRDLYYIPASIVIVKFTLQVDGIETKTVTRTTTVRGRVWRMSVVS